MALSLWGGSDKDIPKEGEKGAHNIFYDQPQLSSPTLQAFRCFLVL